MRFIDKLERKYGRYGIENLTMYIIISYVLGYALMYINPGALSMLSLNVTKILQGQVWRLITWIVYPPSTSSPLWFVIAILFFYYPISASLEHTWGKFKFTLYILSGMIFTVIAAFILHFVMGGVLDGLGGIIFSTYYISLSIFLAYSLTYPDMTVLLMFVIPIKMKWMAFVYVAMALYYFFTGSLATKVAIAASLLNFVIFFLSSRNMKRFSPKEQARKAKFKQQTRPHMTYANGARHRCAVCGRTELDDPTLEFRFCSKCNGNYEYCQDHLFTHEHVK